MSTMLLLKLIVFCFGVYVEGKIITTGLMTSSGTEEQKKVIGPIEENKSEDSREDVNEFAKKYGVGLRVNEVDVRNESNIVRPCSFKNLECMRKFLAKNSECSIVRGPIPDPLYLAQSTLFFPHSNITLTLADLVITGLTNVKVVEFNYNKKTKVLIMAFEVRNLNETTKTQGYFSFRRRAKQSIVLADRCSIFFNILTLTIEIPIIPELRLDLALTHVYLDEEIPEYYIGPKAFDSDDPDVQEGFEDFKNNFPIIIQEAFLYQAQLFTAVIIQNYFCDFDVKLFSL